MTSGLLTPLSWLYQGGVRLRHWFYDQKILNEQVAPLPVVSVGNLVAGGSGKTQVVLMLAQHLAGTLRVAVLSRGYRGEAEHGAEPLLVDIRRHAAHESGDEPWLLASRLPSALVVVSKNRYKSALAAHKWGAELLILDDGMQHRSLHRDFEIVVIDGKSRFGSFLPKGRLRDEPSRLATANLVLFVGDPEPAVLQKVSSLTSAPQVVAHIKSEGVFDLGGSPLTTGVQGKKVAIFCGIGNPSRFVHSVEALGAHVVAAHFSSDHRLPTQKELQSFAQRASGEGAEMLLCTEKDKVKLPSYALPLPAFWVKVSLSLAGNPEGWLKAVNTIKSIAGAAP